MLSKKEKKNKLSGLRAAEKRIFYENLCVSKEIFEAFAHHLDKKLQKYGCQDTREFSFQFLADHVIDSSALIAWLEYEGPFFEAEGASCDCDILWIIHCSDKIDTQFLYFMC